MKELIRVKYKKQWIHPTNKRRARSLVNKDRAMFVQDTRGWFLMMKDVSEFNPEWSTPVVMGADTGSHFDGITIISSKGQYNVEYKADPNKLDHSSKQSIVNNTELRNMYKRLRRERKLHRPVRNNNRSGNRMTKTQNYFYSRLKYHILSNAKQYAVTYIVLEFIKPKGYENCKGLTWANTSLNRIMKDIKCLDINLVTKSGWETSNLRNKIFKKDPKLKNKNEDSFYAHCVDSYVLTRFQCNFPLFSTKTVIFQKKSVLNSRIKRRSHAEFLMLRGNKKEYVRYSKGQVPHVIEHMSKKKKIRVKKIDPSWSKKKRIQQNRNNHGNWEYQYSEVVPTKKSKVYQNEISFWNQNTKQHYFGKFLDHKIRPSDVKVVYG